MEASAVQQFFATLQDRFSAEEAYGVKATYQFNISGDGGGAWAVAIEDGQCAITEGAVESPSAVIATDAVTWMGLVNGTTDGPLSFMTGKLKVTGNMMLAVKLKKLFFDAAKKKSGPW